MKTIETIKGYKAVDKNLYCRNVQFEVGAWKVHTGELCLCENGFHFCKNPTSLLQFKTPGNSRFFKIEARGNIKSSECMDVSVCSEIRLVEEVTLEELFLGPIMPDYITKSKEKIERRAIHYEYSAFSIGDGNVCITSHYTGSAVSEGRNAIAACDGVASHARVKNNNSVAVAHHHNSLAIAGGSASFAMAFGLHSVAQAQKDAFAVGVSGLSYAKGDTGSYLLLIEYNRVDAPEEGIKNSKLLYVDGKKIKSDTQYRLVNGEVEEVVAVNDHRLY